MIKSNIMRGIFLLLLVVQLSSAQEYVIYPSDPVHSLNIGREVTSTNEYIATNARHIPEQVYIFRKDGVVWIQEAVLSVSDSTDSRLFGTSLSSYNNHLLVGACSEYENGIKSGAAYIFRRENNEWQQEARLIPSTLEDNQCFGNDVVIHNNVALVSADDEINGQTSVGAVYIFERTGDQWLEIGKLIPSDPDPVAGFGRSIDMTDQHIFVGAPAAFDEDSLRTGAVYVFEKIGNEWVEQTKLIADDIQKGDGFFQIEVFEETLYVGASKAGGNNLQHKGAVYIFEYAGDEWIQTHKLIPEDGTDLNKNLWRFCLNGNYLALSNSDNSQYSTVYFFQKKGNDWEQINVLSGIPEDIDRYGRGMDISDDHLFVGAWASFYQDSDSIRSGAVYVYDLDILVSNPEIRKEEQEEIVLSPNPAGDLLTIEIRHNSLIEIKGLKVFDLQGRQLSVPSKVITGIRWRIDTTILNTGTYFIRVITSDKKEWNKPFIKM